MAGLCDRMLDRELKKGSAELLAERETWREFVLAVDLITGGSNA